MTIHGEDTNEELVFNLKNSFEEAPSKTISFKENNILGTIQKPLVLKKESEILDTDLLVWPNPFEKSLNVKLYSLKKNKAKVQVASSIGSIVYDTEFDLKEGSNVLSFSLDDLSNGVYQMKIIVGQKVYMNSLVK